VTLGWWRYWFNIAGQTAHVGHRQTDPQQSTKVKTISVASSTALPVHLDDSRASERRRRSRGGLKGQPTGVGLRARRWCRSCAGDRCVFLPRPLLFVRAARNSTGKLPRSGHEVLARTADHLKSGETLRCVAPVTRQIHHHRRHRRRAATCSRRAPLLHGVLLGLDDGDWVRGGAGECQARRDTRGRHRPAEVRDSRCAGAETLTLRHQSLPKWLETASA